MYIYLSKKIAIPSNIALQCLSWNAEQGYIACGGDDGLLKVLKLDPSESKDPRAPRGIAAPTELSMNQTLEGHNGAVICATWNSRFRKLTTSDSSGLIIVWMLHKGVWYEEMINNRNKSVVRDMQWTADGQKIAIVYEDGAVIVGSVDGNRLWGKELQTLLRLVQWAPDGRSIIFVKGEREVDLYDMAGNRLMSLPLYVLEDVGGKRCEVVSLDWYDGMEGYVSPDAPSLAIAFDVGLLQITRGPMDNNAVKIETGLKIVQCKWNTNGSILAVGGYQKSTSAGGEEKTSILMIFYSPFGQLIRTLKVPGSRLAAFSWEGGGLKLSLAVDSFIYFANVRPRYKWTFFTHTLSYCYTRVGRDDQCMFFYDVQSDDRFPKYTRDLMGVTSSGQYCIMATTCADPATPYSIVLCSTIGSPVDTKHIAIHPKHLCMTKYHAIVASEEQVYVWHYRSAASKLTTISSEAKSTAPLYEFARHKSRERTFHIDDQNPSTDSDLSFKPTKDPISSVTASESSLIVARQSGLIHRYSLPHISLENKYTVRARPHHIALNCDDSRLSIIDANGVLTMITIETQPSASGKQDILASDFEKKDVWSVLWAEDNPELIAVMEKTKLIVYRGKTPEDAIITSGYPCRFKDLEVAVTLLDELMMEPERPYKDIVVTYETKSLKTAIDTLDSKGLQDAVELIKKDPHPKLWRIVGEAALKELNFGVADLAFVNCSDYYSIQLIKKLQNLDDKKKQLAEVAIYFERFDEAENVYREMDRKDLALDLRIRMGDWFRVVALQQSGAGDDRMLVTAWNMIGEYYSDRLKWGKAAQYYSQAKNFPSLIKCFFATEDYESLERVGRSLPDGSPLLQEIALKFQSVGICDYAVSAFLKSGNTKAAVDACVLLHQWDRAVALAKEHNFPQIEGLMAKYVSQLLEKNRQVQAIELYRKAGKNPDAARLLAKVAEEIGKSKANPVRAKKLFVLAALEVEAFRKNSLSAQGTDGMTTAQSTSKALDTLLQQDQTTMTQAATTGSGFGAASSRVLDNAWRGPLAYHLYLLSHRQLYLGELDNAMKTSLRLPEYEDILDMKDIYSLIAFTAYHNKFYRECSKAFTKLESLPQLSREQKAEYSDLAMKIFLDHPPNDPSLSKKSKCPTCEEDVKEWANSCQSCKTQFPICMASGRAVLTNEPLYYCKTCRQATLEREVDKFGYCLLCHAPLMF